MLLLAQALLIVCIAVEEHVCNVVLLAALEDRALAHTCVKFLVFRANTGRSGVQHDITLLNQILERTRDRDAGFLQLVVVFRHSAVKMVGHAGLDQAANRQGRRNIGNTDKLHILLHCNTRRQTQPDDTITCNANFDLTHFAFLL